MQTFFCRKTNGMDLKKIIGQVWNAFTSLCVRRTDCLSVFLLPLQPVNRKVEHIVNFTDTALI